MRVNFNELDKFSDENFKAGNFSGTLPTGKMVEKSEIIRGNFLKQFKVFFNKFDALYCLIIFFC